MAAKQISLKLMINKKSNRVVFAESDKDFVEILLSFLTLPMGTIIRLLGKQSTVGCMDKLYQSVENLDTQYLRTDACKTMLLYPRNAAEDLCKSLAVNTDDPEHSRYYICSSWSCNCTRAGYHLISSVKNVPCGCGIQMDRSVSPRTSDGVGDAEREFVEGSVRYMISDDLHVMPVSLTNTLPLLKKLGVEDEDSLEVRTLNVSADELLYLLKRALLSNTPLTDAFLLERDAVEAVNIEPDMTQFQPATETSSNTKTMKVKLLLRKSSNTVLCAEAREEFMDLLFRFLTFPLGSIIKLLDRNSCMGCIDHLYKSAVDLGASEHIKSEKCKEMLITPMLAPHYGCKNQLLDVKEVVLQGRSTISICYTCVTEELEECTHGSTGAVSLTRKDPKDDGKMASGGGFVNVRTIFMVTNELDVKTLSPISFLSGLNMPITELDERVVSLGEKEALALLKASLISKTALSHAFAKSLERTLEKKSVATPS